MYFISFPIFSVPGSGCRLDGMKPAKRPMSMAARLMVNPSKGGAPGSVRPWSVMAMRGAVGPSGCGRSGAGRSGPAFAARRKPSFFPTVRRVGRPRGGRARANVFAGVRWPGTYPGRAFRMSRTRFTRASVTRRKSVPVGGYRRGGPSVCPFRPRSREWQGVAKKPVPGAFATFARPANSLPLSAVIVWTLAPRPLRRSVIAFPTTSALFPSTLWTGGCFDARSTGDTTAPPWPFPITVSASRSPVPTFSPTVSGRSGMSLRPGIWPRPGCGRISAACPPCWGPPAGDGLRSVPGSSPPRLRHDRRPATVRQLPRNRRCPAPAHRRLPPRLPVPISPPAVAATELTRYQGGRYRETWVAANAGRPTGTCIYFLLAAGERSHWHKVDAVEIWLYHAGAPLILSLSETEQGPVQDHVLTPGLTRGAPQLIVPEHIWQSASSTGDWPLVSCTVSPGFQFDGFVLAPVDFDISRTDDGPT